MKTIKVYGPGCKKCKLLEANVKEAISRLPGDFEVQKIEDMAEMAKIGMMSSPGLSINDKLISTGKVQTVDELVEMLSHV